jgi:hypothetical protein
MNAPTASLAALEKSLAADEEAQLGRLPEQKGVQPAPVDTDAERIRSSVARLTATSIEGLEGLSSELQQLQSFLRSEVERVQGEIESAVAGIKIIMDTIAPWKATLAPTAPPGRPFRGGPAANIESGQPRR